MMVVLFGVSGIVLAFISGGIGASMFIDALMGRVVPNSAILVFFILGTLATIFECAAHRMECLEREIRKLKSTPE